MMTTVQTISYEVSGELPYGPQGPISYAGVQLDAGDPRMRRFLDQVTPGFGASTNQRSHLQITPQKQPDNYFPPPPVTASSRRAIAAEAATLGRARSLSPTLQQRQQRETDYNYLRHNYQPTWVDTIDEIYNPDAAELHEVAAPRLACSYTCAPGLQHHQPLQHECHGHEYGQDTFESRQHIQQQISQCCQHCPDRNDSQLPPNNSEQRAASLSPQKSYHFIYQKQRNQHSQHQQQQQQQSTTGNWSKPHTIVTTVNERTQSQPPAPLLQHANVGHRKPRNASSRKQCQNCGCHSVQPQEQNWQNDQRLTVQSEQREQQHQQQLIQHQNAYEESRVESNQHKHNIQPHQQHLQQQHTHRQQQVHGQQQNVNEQHTKHEFQQNTTQKESQKYDIVVQHDSSKLHQKQQPVRQQQQQHGIGYYQMLKQQQQQQTKGKPLLDSPIQKQQHQPKKQQNTYQPQQRKTYYIEHCQENIPVQQQHVHQQHKQQNLTVNQQQFNQSEEPTLQVYYPQQEYSYQQHNYQQQPEHRNQQQTIYQHKDEQQKQHAHRHLQQLYGMDNYDNNQQLLQQQNNNKHTVSIERQQYFGGKPKSDHLYFSSRGAAENEASAPLIFTTGFGDRHPERLTGAPVSYRQLARRSQSENPRRHHSPVPGASERGYQYGGMNFVDHDGPLLFRADDFTPSSSLPTPHTRKSLEKLPLRRPGDHHGLDYSTHPAAASLSPTREDIEWYHGYAPRVPRQHWKFSADPDAPLNNYEVAIWDQVDPTGLVGDTLSNQKIASEPPLSEQEKNQFCVEFAPPVGLRPEHRTVIPVPVDPEPICMSLSANKDKLKNAQSQNQYRTNTASHAGHSLNSTEDSSWYSNGKKKVMRGDPNWSRNVVLRKQAWEGETNGKETTRSNWAHNGRTQQQQKEQPLQHNEQQGITRSAHWVKQQENEQKEQQPVKQEPQQQKMETPQKSQPQRYPKQYVNQWQLSQRDQYEQHHHNKQQSKNVVKEQQLDDNDVDVVIEEVEIDQVDLDKSNLQGHHKHQITFTQYQRSGQPFEDRQFIVQNKNPQSKGQPASKTQFPQDAKPMEHVNGNTLRQSGGDGTGVRQINRNEFVS